MAQVNYFNALRQKKYRLAHAQEMAALDYDVQTESSCTRCEFYKYCKSHVLFTILEHGEAFVLPCEAESEHREARRAGCHYHLSGKRKQAEEQA